MAGGSQTGQGVPSWGELREAAVAAVEADIDTIVRNGTGKCLTPRAVGLPAGARTLAVPLRRRPSVQLKDQLFYIVDADLRRPTADDRHVARFGRLLANELQLELPEETRAALRGVHSVRAFYVDDIKLKLKRALLELLERASAGDLAVDLWRADDNRDTDPLPERPTARSLHKSQDEALAALTSPGGWFVWGPPGTGKTTVITEAVRRMLPAGLSVLIASHTHVAVDNVLEGLIDPETGVDFECGDVIRVASMTTRDRVSALVKEHPFLLIDDAAAVLNRSAERREGLLGEIKANRAHEARVEREVLDQKLLGSDPRAITQARCVVAARERLMTLEGERGPIEVVLVEVNEEIKAYERSIASLDVTDAERREVADRLQRGEARRVEAQRGWEAAAAAVEQAEAERDALGARVALAQEATRSWSGRVFPPLGTRRARHESSLRVEYMDASQAIEQLGELRDQAVRHYERSRAAADEARAERERLEHRIAHAIELRSEAQRLRGEHDELAQALSVVDQQIEEQRQLAGASSANAARATVEEALRNGWLDALDRIEDVTAVVDGLDEQMEKLQRDLRKVDLEESETRSRLRREASIVGCTLSAFSMDWVLRARSFDVVILDEASSIEAAAVILAGSRAERTFAVVGDFLQNAPISEADSNSEAPDPHPWQETDIFALAGIRDHQSAQEHGRCIPLRCQHRFPRIIADVVNEFCYGGMLETATHVDAEAVGPVVTMVDTSGRFDQELTRDDSSWWSKLGLDLLRAIASRPDLCAGTSVGFITPYRPQAERARALRLVTPTGAAIECGTAHAFQGRQYDTVIVDLMQDRRTRWVGKADLHGSAHAVAAAKLLNVALTRTKLRLYLIGDWDYIRRSSAPGMLALTGLEGQRGFVRLDAAEFLGRT